jgi:hypothetical protein
MAQYKVTVGAGPDIDTDIREAHSPLEAAFLTGVALGTSVMWRAILDYPKLFDMTERRAQDLVAETTREGLSGVSVEEIADAC